jgi:hypothetical protein
MSLPYYILIPVVMHFVRVKYGMRMKRFGGKPQRNNRERQYIPWYCEYFPYPLHAIFFRIQPQPYSSQTLSLRRQKNVLGGGGAILNEELI